MRTTPPAQNTNGKTYIGMDNGVSGSIGIIDSTGTQTLFFQMPTFSELNYTKEVKHITRIDFSRLENILKNCTCPLVIMERPMVNPQRFQASASALRALEATLIVLERLELPKMYIDSKEWQKVMLPHGIKGSDKLKAASLDIGKRLFPQFSGLYKTDADGILIAEWARRKCL